MHISKSQLEGIMRTYINNSDHVRNKSDKKTRRFTDEVSL